jgi:hypothetical protein
MDDNRSFDFRIVMTKSNIKTAFPSNALIAKTLGVSKDRAQHIENLVDTLLAHPKIGQAAFLKEYLKRKKTKGIKKAAQIIRKKR